MIESDFAVHVIHEQLEAGCYEIIVDDAGRDMKRLLALPAEEIPAAFGASKAQSTDPEEAAHGLVGSLFLLVCRTSGAAPRAWDAIAHQDGMALPAGSVAGWPTTATIRTGQA